MNHSRASRYTFARQSSTALSSPLRHLVLFPLQNLPCWEVARQHATARFPMQEIEYGNRTFCSTLSWELILPPMIGGHPDCGSRISEVVFVAPLAIGEHGACLCLHNNIWIWNRGSTLTRAAGPRHEAPSSSFWRAHV